MRRVLTRGFGMMALAAAMVLTGTSAEAQRRPKPPKNNPAQPAPVDLDADSPAPAKPGKAGKVGRQLAAGAGRSADRRGRAGQAPLREREVVGRRAGALPRVERRDRRRRGQQADRPVQPREGALQAQVLPGRVLDLQRDRRQAEPPQVQRDAPLAREARDRPAGAGGHRRARRQVQRRAGRASSTTRSSRTSTGS